MKGENYSEPADIERWTKVALLRCRRASAPARTYDTLRAGDRCEHCAYFYITQWLCCLCFVCIHSHITPVIHTNIHGDENSASVSRISRCKGTLIRWRQYICHLSSFIITFSCCFLLLLQINACERSACRYHDQNAQFLLKVT